MGFFRGDKLLTIDFVLDFCNSLFKGLLGEPEVNLFKGLPGEPGDLGEKLDFINYESGSLRGLGSWEVSFVKLELLFPSIDSFVEVSTTLDCLLIFLLIACFMLD